MKRLLPISLLLAALCISTAAFAQKDKVVEASSKRKPAWIGSSDRSHFAVTEVGETLAAASGKCMASIRQYIVNAVAVNVSSAEKMATRQITRDQLVTAMSDYSSALMTEAGQLPYLNDITLSNAEAVYWERIYSKKTKTYRYEYSVLYPFPEQTRRQLIEAFVAIDDAKQAEYERLRRELGTITDIDRIRLAVNELDGLYDYFFDATRKGDVETLRRNYRALYNAVSIEVESEAPGECVYSLRLDGRPAPAARAPSRGIVWSGPTPLRATAATCSPMTRSTLRRPISTRSKCSTCSAVRACRRRSFSIRPGTPFQSGPRARSGSNSPAG